MLKLVEVVYREHTASADAVEGPSCSDGMVVEEIEECVMHCPIDQLQKGGGHKLRPAEDRPTMGLSIKIPASRQPVTKTAAHLRCH
jgi:hypothetical protein